MYVILKVIFKFAPKPRKYALKIISAPPKWIKLLDQNEVPPFYYIIKIKISDLKVIEPAITLAESYINLTRVMATNNIRYVLANHGGCLITEGKKIVDFCFEFFCLK